MAAFCNYVEQNYEEEYVSASIDIESLSDEWNDIEKNGLFRVKSETFKNKN